METIAFIFARQGSKGLPGKNLMTFCGKPLVAWSITQAKAVERIQRVIVSTDCERIADIARQYGAETPFLRPAELARDNTPEWLAWRHALSFLLETEGHLPDAMVSVPPTAPLRSPADIELCLEEFDKGLADVVITVSESQRSPYFNMVTRTPDGAARLVCPPVSPVSRRQETPAVYDIATVAYVVHPAFVLLPASSGLWSGRTRAVIVPRDRAIDIDTQLDFDIAEAIMLQRGNATRTGMR